MSLDRAPVLAYAGTSLGAARLFEALPRRPIVSVNAAMTILATTKPTASRAIEILVEAGVLAEMTGKKRDRA